jgi:uncharacterized protein YdeI (YjbR/CyaY-like superfamily)
MSESAADLPTIHPRDRQEWRTWLEEHHATSSGVWLISFKKGTGQPRVTYDEAVEEALCFGWVDSRSKALDERRSMQLFTPRKPGSTWCRSNKERVAVLIEQGRMARAGLDKVEAAQRDGSWNKLDAIEALTVPPDLEQALAANPVAARHFEAFSNSAKKNILGWIQSAKRPETRRKRIEVTVTLAAQNKNAHLPRQ